MSYSLSELLACVCVFESIENEEKLLPKLVLQTNLTAIQQYYHEKLGPVDANVELSMRKPYLYPSRVVKGDKQAQTAQCLLNIFHNVCNDKEFRSTLHPLTNISLPLKACMTSEANLVEKVFKTSYQQCICGCNLGFTFRDRKGKRGQQSICYDNVLGPQSAILYTFRCRTDRKGCGRLYKFGSVTETNRVVQYSSLQDSDYFQGTSCTMFHKNVFNELQLGLIEDGDSFSSYVNRYNNRFAEKHEQLARNSQAHGKRKSTLLTQDGLNDAFFHFKLQMFVEQELHQQMTLTAEDFEEIHKYETRIKALFNSSTSDNSSTSVNSNNTSHNTNSISNSNSTSLNTKSISNSNSTSLNDNITSLNVNNTSSSNSSASTKNNNTSAVNSVKHQTNRFRFRHLFKKYEYVLTTLVPTC